MAGGVSWTANGGNKNNGRLIIARYWGEDEKFGQYINNNGNPVINQSEVE